MSANFGVGQKFERDAVHRLGAGIDIAFGWTYLCE